MQLSDIQQGLLCCTIFVVIRAMFGGRQLNAIFVDNSMAHRYSARNPSPRGFFSRILFERFDLDIE